MSFLFLVLAVFTCACGLVGVVCAVGAIALWAEQHLGFWAKLIGYLLALSLCIAALLKIWGAA